MSINTKKFFLLIFIIFLLSFPKKASLVCQCRNQCSGCGSCCIVPFLWWCLKSCDCGPGKMAWGGANCSPALDETILSCNGFCLCSCSKSCGAQCEKNSDCPNNTCSATYNDYCREDSLKLTDYNGNCVKDSVTVTNSCSNYCQSDCTCTKCSVSIVLLPHLLSIVAQEFVEQNAAMAKQSLALNHVPIKNASTVPVKQ